MKRKIFLTTILTILLSVGIVRATETLFEYYQGRLPSIADRAKIATEAGLIKEFGKYRGTYSQNTALLNYLQNTAFSIGAGGGTAVTDFESTLTVPLTASTTTIPVASMNTFDKHTLTTADIEPAVYLILEAGGAKQEIVKCTEIGGLYFTGCTRGLAFYGRTETSVTANKKTHSAGTTVTLSNVHYYYLSSNNANTWPAEQTFRETIFNLFPTSGQGATLPTTTTQFATKLYVDGVGAGGFTSVNIGDGKTLRANGTSPETMDINTTTNAYYFKLNSDKQFITSTSTVANGTASGTAVDDAFNARYNATTTKETFTLNRLTVTNATMTNATTSNNLYIGGNIFGNLGKLASTSPATSTLENAFTETALFSTIIPAGALGTAGMINVTMRINSHIDLVSNILKVYYGTKQVCNWRIGDLESEGNCYIFSHNGTANQIGHGLLRPFINNSVPGYSYHSSSTAITVDSTAAQTLQITTQGGSNSTSTLIFGFVEYYTKN